MSRRRDGAGVDAGDECRRHGRRTGRAVANHSHSRLVYLHVPAVNMAYPESAKPGRLKSFPH